MTRELPIVAASGLSASNQASELNRMGVNVFLTKPYNAQTLLQALHKLLQEAESP